jgi:hypothetical protein
MRTVLCVVLTIGMATKDSAGQTTIASKRNHDFYVSLMSKSGKLAEKTNIVSHSVGKIAASTGTS